MRETYFDELWEDIQLPSWPGNIIYFMGFGSELDRPRNPKFCRETNLSHETKNG